MGMNFESEQAMVDYVVDFMRKQQQGSVSGNDLCAYRGLNGTKCAVGAMILDEDYRKGMEGHMVEYLSPAALPTCNGEIPFRLLANLQYAHDSVALTHTGNFVGSFEDRLKSSLEHLGLKVSPASDPA